MTRLYKNVVSSRLIRIKNKTQYLRQNLLSMLCIFLIGFLSGNLFGTILNNLRNWVRWDGFIIFGLIAKIEAISYFSYKSTEWSCVCFAQRAWQKKGSKYSCVGRKPSSSLCKSEICNSVGNPKDCNFTGSPGVCAAKLWSPKVCKAKLCTATKVFDWHTNRKKSYKFGRAFWNNLNLFKIGIMVGFFVDAFKVGS